MRAALDRLKPEPVEMVDLSTLVLDPGVPVDPDVDEATVSRYAVALSEPRIPWQPLLVVEVEGRRIVADGRHRLLAAQRAALKQVPITPRLGGDSSAPRLFRLVTYWDRKKSLLIFLEEEGQGKFSVQRALTDDQVADLFGQPVHLVTDNRSRVVTSNLKGGASWD